MTPKERVRVVDRAFSRAMRTMDPKAFPLFRDRSMRAIIGAAVLLNRDPVDLAHQLSDGQLAEIIRAAESTIPLPLDDPRPIRGSMRDLLEEAASWAEHERDLLERRVRRVLGRFDRVAAELRDRTRREGAWQAEWRNLRSMSFYDENWEKRVPDDRGSDSLTD